MTRDVQVGSFNHSSTQVIGVLICDCCYLTSTSSVSSMGIGDDLCTAVERGNMQEARRLSDQLLASHQDLNTLYKVSEEQSELYYDNIQLFYVI